MRPNGNGLARAGAALAIVALLGACSTGGHASTGGTTTTSGRSSELAAPFPPGTRPPDIGAAIALLGAFFETDPSVHWYAGGGFESSDGHTTAVGADVFASTAGAARKYCAPLSRAAAFFLQGHDYTLDVQGSVIQPSGVVVAARFPHLPCPHYSGPIVDPVAAGVPATLPAAARRFGKFLDEYIGSFGLSDQDPWEFHSAAAGGRVTVEVDDATAAAGLQRCTSIRPLADWFLGRFANAATIRVASGPNASWPASNCP